VGFDSFRAGSERLAAAFIVALARGTANREDPFVMLDSCGVLGDEGRAVMKVE
jgi:hypothetical protein